MPPLQKALLPIPLGIGGIDTRGDAKTIASPALAVLENGQVRTPGRIEKRRGMAALPLNVTVATGSLAAGDSIAPLRALSRRQDALVAIGTTANYKLIPARGWEPSGFTDPSGFAALSVLASYEAALTKFGDSLHCDRTRAAGVDYSLVETDIGGISAIYCWGHEVASGASAVVGVSGSSRTRPRVITVSDRARGFYVITSSSSLVMLQFPPGDPRVRGPSVTVITDLGASALYDVAVSGGRILLAYVNTAGDIKYGYLDPSGALDGALSTETPTAAPVALAVAVDPATRAFAVMWGMDANTDVAARIFQEDKTALVATTVVDGSATGGIRNVVGAFQATNDLTVFHELTGAATYLNLVRRARLTTGGTTSVVTWARHSGIASKPFVRTGGVFILLAHKSTLQSTIFLVRARTTTPSATEDMDTIGALFAGKAVALSTRVGYVAQVAAHANDEYGFIALTQEATGLIQLPQRLVLAMNDVQAHTYVVAQDATYMVGLQSWKVDTQARGAETGFHLYPENITLQSSAAAGALVAGKTYRYRFYWETDGDTGAREISTFAAEYTITVGAGHDTVTATIPTLTHTNKLPFTPAWLAAYRTAIDPEDLIAGAEAIFQRVSSRQSTTMGPNGYLANDPSVDTVSFVDKMSDATLLTKEADYLSGDPVEFENIAPPPHTCIAQGNNRVALSGMEDPNIIWISKLRDFQQALAFSDELTVSVDAGEGPITGLAWMSDSLIVFRARQTYIVGGDGPDNANNGGAFTPPRIISDDVGCIAPRSIVRIPAGVMFKSQKGFYLCDGSQMQYIGAMVEGFNGEAVTGAVAMPGSHEVRFTTTSRTLVYDYLVGAWSTWTVPAISTLLWTDRWTALQTSSGPALVEDPTAYTDNGQPYTMAIETAWIRPGALQGFWRVWRILFLGSYRGVSRPIVKIAYDYETGADGTPIWTDIYEWEAVGLMGADVYGDQATYGAEGFGGDVIVDGEVTPASSVYQFQVMPSQGRCESIKIRIEDAPIVGGGVLGDSFTLSEITLEVGVKQGPMRLGPSKSA